MAITARALLKKWFGRGQYPSAEQFSSVFDSFYHKEEDHLSIGQVEGLAGQLNGKYDATRAAVLEERIDRAVTQSDELRQDVTNAFDSIVEVENRVENDCIQITTQLVLRGGSPADLVNNA